MRAQQERAHFVADEHVGVRERRETSDIVVKCILGWLVVYCWYVERSKIWVGWKIFEAGVNKLD